MSSKLSNQLCILLLLLLQAASLRCCNPQLVIGAAAEIGDEFLCQDPIRGPISLMLSNAPDQLASAPFTQPQDQVVFLDEEEAFSAAADQNPEDDEEVLLSDGYPADPHRSAAEEGEFVREEQEADDDLLPLSVQDAEEEDGEFVREVEEADDDLLPLSVQYAEEEEGEFVREVEEADGVLLPLSVQDAQVESSSNNSEEHGSSPEVQCPECGKSFRNDKSMFGHLRSHPNRGYKANKGPRLRSHARVYKGATPPVTKAKPLSNRDAAPLPLVNDDSRPVARYSQRDPKLTSFEILTAYLMLTLKQRGNGAAAQDQSRKRKPESDEPNVPKEDDVVTSKDGNDVVLGDEHGTTASAMAGDGAVYRSEQSKSLAEMEGNYAVLGDKHGTTAAAMTGDGVVCCSEQGKSLAEMAGNDVVLGDKHGTTAAAMAGDGAVYRSEQGKSLAEMSGDDAVHHSEQGISLAVAEMAGVDVVPQNRLGSPVAEMAGDAILRNEHVNKEIARKRGRKKSKKDKEDREEKDVPSATKVKRPYFCKHCKAEFPTHQALGGHMAAHNKEQRMQAQNEQAAAESAWRVHQIKIDQSLIRQETKAVFEGPRRSGMPMSTSREQLLERYTDLFNQGCQARQEAAVSKRKHTEREDAGGCPPVELAVADGGRRRPFDIDLNVAAPEKE